MKKEAGRVASARPSETRSDSLAEFNKSRALRGRLRANVDELRETVWQLEQNLEEACRSVQTQRGTRKHSRGNTSQ